MAQRYQGGKSRGGPKRKFNPLLSGGIIVGIVVLVLAIGPTAGWWGATVEDPVDVPAQTVVDDEFNFEVLGYFDSEELDEDIHEIYIYEVDVSDLTTDEIDDLEFTDYTLADNKDSGESFDIEDEYQYYCKLNGSDIDEYWFVPVAGMNTVYAMNSTEDMAMIAYSSDEFSTTVLNTTYDEWTIMTQTLTDSEGTGKPTSTQGFQSYYDFELDDWVNFQIRITFNTTALDTYVDYDGPGSATITPSGNYLYIEVSTTVYGSMDFHLDFDSDVLTGSTTGTVTPTAISIGTGYGSTFTAFDTQA